MFNIVKILLRHRLGTQLLLLLLYFNLEIIHVNQPLIEIRAC